MQKHPGSSFVIQRAGIARNSLYNGLGLGLPILVAVFSMPALVANLGPERLGILSLAWILIGYFSIFDFGLGRAITKLVAERLGKGERSDVPALIATALALMLATGALGAGMLGLSASYIVNSILSLPANLKSDALYSFYAIALCIPFVTVTSGFRGVLEGNQEFKGINIVRALLGISNYLIPAIVSYYWPSALGMVATLVVFRMASFAMHYYLCSRLYTASEIFPRWHSIHIKPLLSFGGWITIANLLAPLLVYVDRLVIGIYLPISAVGFYATSYDMASKLWVIPGAIAATLLPAAASASPAGSVELYAKAMRYVFVLLFPFCLTIIALAPQVLLLWLGPEFSENASTVLRIVVAGVFFNSFAQLSSVRFQAQGRPQILVRILAVQVPFFIPALILVVPKYGINGAAWVWFARVIIDSSIFVFLATAATVSIRAIVYKLALLSGVAFLMLAIVPAGLWQWLTLTTALIFWASLSAGWLITVNEWKQAAQVARVALTNMGIRT